MLPRVADLAKSLQPVAEMFGVPAAQTLVREFPGTVLRVPRTWREDLDLNRAGIELAQEMCRVFGGEHLLIPKTLLTMEARHREVYALAERRRTAAQIALETGFAERQVRRILNSGPVTARRRPGRFVDPRQINFLDS